MNSLGLDLKIIEQDEEFELDGIVFNKVGLLWPNSKSDLIKYVGDPGVVYFSELEKSLNGSGFYLIFTAVNGIAESSGWDYVKVEHINGLVNWEFWFNSDLINLSFDLVDYHSEIMKIKDKVESLPLGIILEPSQVFFPDD